MCAQHSDQTPPESPSEGDGSSTTALAPRPGFLARMFVLLVRFYQVNISPLKPPVCRYTPSCSEYTRQAIVKYGAFRGSYMGFKRIMRCHPFHPGGYDPVP